MPNVTLGKYFTLGEVFKEWRLFVDITILWFDICYIVDALFDQLLILYMGD